ncbi:MAG: response regulator [Rhodothermales bacterium]|nr:response regulator [Rhodothermales bacterium]
MWRKSQVAKPQRGNVVPRTPVNPDAIGGIGTESQPPPTDAANEQPESENPGPLRILVVEDNAINRKVMELTLRRMGYEADMAVDGLEAVEMATAKEYDAILMDLHMPGMGGIEATKVIVGAVPKPPRVVAVTADVTSQSREDCKRVGMAAYLTKPVDSGKLLYELKAAEVHRLSYAKTG